jgi:hypothetical protein
MKLRKLLAIISLLVIFAALPVVAQEKLTGDQIIEKHLAAVGGRTALTKFKTRVAVGTIKRENEPAGQMAVMSEYPNRLSIFYGFRDFDLQMIYDGNKAFFRPNLRTDLAPLSDKYQEMLSSGLMLNSISLHNLITNSAPGELKFESKGMKKVGGQPSYGVQIKTRSGTQMKLYFDADSFMWVRTEYGSTSVARQMGSFTNDVVNQGGTETTFDFYVETSDFREVDGVKLPFRFVQVLTAPFIAQKATGTVVGEIKEYKHNEPIDPKMFR